MISMIGPPLTVWAEVAYKVWTAEMAVAHAGMDVRESLLQSIMTKAENEVHLHAVHDAGHATAQHIRIPDHHTITPSHHHTITPSHTHHHTRTPHHIITPHHTTTSHHIT